MKQETKLKIELENVHRVVKALLAAGYSISIDNGGDEEAETPYLNTFTAIKPELRLTDEDRLYVSKNEKDLHGWVFLVYGNEPEEVVNDYTTNLEEILAPVIKNFE